MVHSRIYCNQFSCHFWWDVVFDRWSSGMHSLLETQCLKGKELREFLQEVQLWRISPIVWHILSPLLVCTSPLAVITFLDVLMVSNWAELGSRLLTKCILAPESTTNYLSSGSFVDAARSTHSSAGKWNAALSHSLRCKCFGKVPSLASGTSLLSFSLLMGPVLKFHSVGT